jgi:serine/threonine protein phosphatase PrpC
MSWAIPRFDHVVEFAGASHAGKVRTSNQDVWRADPGLGLFAVADGMGGHASGEVAAHVAVDAFWAAVRTKDALAVLDAFVSEPSLDARRAVFDVLEKAAVSSNGAVLEAARDVRHRGMGCTLDAAVLLGNKVFLVHVGDGRTYLSRATTTIQLTHDHTLHGSLLQRGLVRPSDPPTPATVLTNAVGRHDNLHVDAVLVDVAEGDRLVLCTDGVYTELEDEDAIRDLARRGLTDAAAVGFVNAAIAHGGRDNATALVVEVGARRVARSREDAAQSSRDADFAAHSCLFSGIAPTFVSQALRAAVEVTFDPDAHVPRFFAGDRVGYIVLEGSLQSPNGWTLGPSDLVYPESIARGGHGTSLCKAIERVRALRIRADDFREVCSRDIELAAKLYERLAYVLARTVT